MSAIRIGGLWSVSVYHRARYWKATGATFRAACAAAIQAAEDAANNE